MLEGRIVVSAIMVAVFAIAVGLSFSYAPESRLLPLVIGIPGLILALIQLFKELREKGVPAVTSKEHAREFVMFAWFFTFVGGLILFGFPYAGPLLVAAYLYFSGGEKWYVALTAAVVAWAILYGVFEEFLGLPLFEGLVYQWLFG
jgi:uncharacterized membrane protein